MKLRDYLKEAKVNDKVRVRVGSDETEGKVIKIDNKSYSIPMFTVKITKGKWKGEKVVKTEKELIIK